MTDTRNPIPYPPAASMLASDARKWYVEAVQRIPSVVERPGNPLDALIAAWSLKSRLRLAAALSLVDAELADELLKALPLPTVDELLERNGAPIAPDAPQKALLELLTITEAERRAFPGTVGESIGLRCWDGKRWNVMTENGWAPEEESDKP